MYKSYIPHPYSHATELKDPRRLVLLSSVTLLICCIMILAGKYFFQDHIHQIIETAYNGESFTLLKKVLDVRADNTVHYYVDKANRYANVAIAATGLYSVILLALGIIYTKTQSLSKKRVFTSTVSIVVILAIGWAIFFYRLDFLPIHVWDEARLANNGLEMVHNGQLLITYYDGKPDVWNTKPPLMVWLLAASIKTFGANELAVRLPSALAALATALMVFLFCAVTLKTVLGGFSASLVLITTAGFTGIHAARTGDYDALLALWSTAYLLSFYLFIHLEKRRGIFLALFVGSVTCAIMTKGVQALIFFPAILTYVLLQKKLTFLLRSRGIYLAGVVVLTIVTSFYITREIFAPGYIEAVLQNEILG